MLHGKVEEHEEEEFKEFKKAWEDEVEAEIAKRNYELLLKLVIIVSWIVFGIGSTLTLATGDVTWMLVSMGAVLIMVIGVGEEPSEKKSSSCSAENSVK